jgi:rod shape-determining protein MreC
VVSIFTYWDERKLFAVIGAVVVAALIALVQIEAARSGRPSILAIAVQTVAMWTESAVASTTNGARSAAGTVVSIPRLAGENQQLRAELHDLRVQNRSISEQLAQRPDALALLRVESASAGSAARVVGFDPENVARTVTIDRGSQAGIGPSAGVVTDEGVVGRVQTTTPLAATVQLITDATSKIPAVAQHGRWWGIATGVPQNGEVAFEYVSQDAKLKVGDLVVTGEGRSFHAGVPIGRIVKIFYPQGALYQTAILRPAVRLGRLDRVYVLRTNVDAP